MQLTEHDSVDEYVRDLVDEMHESHHPESVADQSIVHAEVLNGSFGVGRAKHTLSTVGFRDMGRLTPFEVLSGSEFVSDVDTTYREKAVEVLAWMIGEEQAEREMARKEMRVEKKAQDRLERHFDENGHF